ncbi:MAG: D-2-hydroxyacid dehydrogenase family protein [Homoserinimonas sp.]
MKCVVLDDYQQAAAGAADWGVLAGRVDVTFVDRHMTEADALAELLSDAAIVVAMRERTPITRALIERLPALQLIVTTGMSNPSIDLVAAADHRVVVCGTESASTPPAELTWALILGLARRLVPEASALRDGGPWQSTVGLDLAGSTLGLVGLGEVGERVARVGLAFGMDVAAWSANLSDERAAAVGVRRAGSLIELLATSDVVSIHLRLSDRSSALIDADAIATMKPTSVLINTARSGVVDQSALVRALRDRQIAGAGLDVFDLEPLPVDHPYRRLDNVLATPHLGYVTAANYRRYFTGAVEDIVAFLDGRPVRVLEPLTR